MDLKTEITTTTDVLSYDVCPKSGWYALGFSRAVKLVSLADKNDWAESKVEDGCAQLAFSDDGTLIAILSTLPHQ